MDFDMKFNMPKTESQLKFFNENPIVWMERHIKIGLVDDRLLEAVYKVTEPRGIKFGSKGFYIVVAFIALMSNEHLTHDFQQYRQSNPNPFFYSKLQQNNKN